MIFPTPHGDKLNALLRNDKVPESDHDRIELAIEHYTTWVDTLSAIPIDKDNVSEFVRLLNEYRFFLDIQVIYDSRNNFLYRQKGQLKLDNSVLEEFLPHLVYRILPEMLEGFSIGPQSCFAAIYFSSNIGVGNFSPGPQLRRKDQDFAISRQLYISASFDKEQSEYMDRLETSIGYLCAECKTNLDKTMFQEACATAHDLKTAVPGAQYLLICEWLDMTPISTNGTDVDEVLVLRKSKRIGAHIRRAFATYEGRSDRRDEYIRFLEDNPFSTDVFERLISHIRALLEDQVPEEEDALERGYF